MRVASLRTVNGNLELSTPFDADFVAALKVTVPHYARKWVPERKLWIVSDEYRTAAIQLLRTYFTVVDLDEEAKQRQQREQQREQEQREQQQQREHEQQQQRERAQQWQREWEQQQRQRYKENAAGPHAVMHLLPTAPPELVKVAYRCLALLYHPDRGGDLAQMQKLNRAFDELKR